jgi:GNAT superfamily N-acetyltransferase
LHNVAGITIFWHYLLSSSFGRTMLRTATVEDTGQLATVKKGFGAREVLERLQSLSTANTTWHIWWSADKPLGWALIHWNGKTTAPNYPDLSDLYVNPDARGQGIGTKMLSACEQIVRRAGYDKLGLAVNPDLNPRAYALYQRLGYYAISQDKYLDGVYGGVEDWVIDLEKCL